MPHLTQLAAPLLTTIVAVTSGARVADATDIDARALAASCRTCHQRGESIIPSIDGQSYATLNATLRGYRDGSRAGTVMPQLAKGYTVAELDAIAQYLAAERR